MRLDETLSSFGGVGCFTAASELSLEREAARQGAAEASAGLSGRPGEEEEAGVERRSQGGAWEVGAVLSGQEARVDLERHRGRDLRSSEGLRERVQRLRSLPMGGP